MLKVAHFAEIVLHPRYTYGKLAPPAASRKEAVVTQQSSSELREARQQSNCQGIFANGWNLMGYLPVILGKPIGKPIGKRYFNGI